jgi:hypothetical protein
MRTLITTIPPTSPTIRVGEFAHGRLVPLGGTNFNLGGDSFKKPCSLHEHVSILGPSIVRCEMESVQFYPSMNAREVLANIVEEGYVPGVKERACLIPDNGCVPVRIVFSHLCKLLNKRNGFMRQSYEEALRVRITRRDGSDPHEFVVKLMQDMDVWSIGLGYDDLYDASSVASRLVLVA